MLGFGLLLAVMIVIPMFGPSRGAYTLLNHIGISIVFALSFNMLLGGAGMLSFGHGVYFGLAGFSCVHVMQWIAAGEGIWAHVPVASMPVIGFAMGALVAAVIGWPSCRRSGTAFAMISLGIAELVAAAGYLFDSFFGGEVGVAGDRMAGPVFAGLTLGPVSEVYWFIAFWTFVGLLGTYLFTRTPLGRLSEATRDNAQRVQFVGYDPTRIRYLVFIIAGGFAGLAGGMAAVQNEIFTLSAFSLQASGAVLIAAYLGGIRYFSGPILGAVLMTCIQSSLSDYTSAWLLYIGLLFIAVVMFSPNGFAGIAYGFWQGLRSPAPQQFLRRSAVLAVAATAIATAVVIFSEVAIRWSEGKGEVFAPFGRALRHDGMLTLVAIAVPLAIGVAAIRRLNLLEGRKR
ncbi:MAG: branched-chain amino acid ABC transporter permease [Chelatococcus sp.]|nr:branched-chain amino acid ABC transporter permease [Chelatococcus sp. YT9]MBX3557453.1 branched-chain amino acid ABC transporter permease [Chelatococcus sp.]